MKVTFRQSGGFAGLVRGCDLDTDDLPAAEAAQLEGLVERSRLRAGKAAPHPTARDLIAYEIKVETADGEVAAAFDDASVPAGAEELVRYLQKQAGPQPPL